MIKHSIVMGILITLAAQGNLAWAADAEFNLPEILVTATKSEVTAEQLPHDVSVITSEEIAVKNAQSLKDVLDSLPGVSINRSGGRRTASIRGFESRYVTILVDGQRLLSEPDATYELDRIPLDNVERIEIVRGSGSAIYGADALGGVINIITKKATERKLSLKSTLGSKLENWSQNNNYAISYDSGNKENLSYTVLLKQDKNAAWYKENGTTYFPFGERNNAALHLEYKPLTDTVWNFDASYVKEKTNEYGTFQAMNNILLQTDLAENNERQNYRLGYEKGNKDKGVNVSLYHTRWEKYNDTMNRMTGLYTGNVYGFTSQTGMEVKHHIQLSDKHKITWGGEYRYEIYRGTGIDTGKGLFTKNLQGKVVSGSETTTSYGAIYVQDEWNVTPKVFAVTALRYDDSNKFSSNISPKLGVTYFVAPNVRLKANVGTGFRVPSPNQMFLNLNLVRNGSLVNLKGNPNLQPEESTFYDFSLEKDWGKANGKLTYFYSKIEDMIDEVWLNSNSIQYRNIQEAKLQGLEASLTGKISKALNWFTNYTYLDSVDSKTDARLFNRARHKFSSGLTYTMAEGFQAELSVDAYRSYYFQPSVAVRKNDNYTLCNLHLTKKIDKGQKVLLGFDNLFNQKNEDLSLPGTIIRLGYQVEF